ncbi:hypothetical protein HKX48_006149 [Thoreauomyces humboldtii]|nr:hypothetical protein HKX48_006149 [Thoreauomyces humboldtii]
MLSRTSNSEGCSSSSSAKPVSQFLAHVDRTTATSARSIPHGPPVPTGDPSSSPPSSSRWTNLPSRVSERADPWSPSEFESFRQNAERSNRSFPREPPDGLPLLSPDHREEKGGEGVQDVEEKGEEEDDEFSTEWSDEAFTARSHHRSPPSSHQGSLHGRRPRSAVTVPPSDGNGAAGRRRWADEFSAATEELSVVAEGPAFWDGLFSAGDDAGRGCDQGGARPDWNWNKVFAVPADSDGAVVVERAGKRMVGMDGGPAVIRDDYERMTVTSRRRLDMLLGQLRQSPRPSGAALVS